MNDERNATISINMQTEIFKYKYLLQIRDPNNNDNLFRDANTSAAQTNSLRIYTTRDLFYPPCHGVKRKVRRDYIFDLFQKLPWRGLYA